MRRYQLGAAIVATIVSLPIATDWSEASELADAVRGIAQEVIDSGKAVGLSIAIAKGDDVLLAEGYGLADLEAKAPATASTVYRIGSITKQFTAVAILQLAEREKLSLDDPLTKFLPDYPQHDPTVTLRHLLQHTSGIQSLTDLPSYRRLMRDEVSHEEMIDRFRELPLHFETGKRFKYCNSGYYLLGVVIESASELSYEDYLQQHIFTPLKLKQTYYDRAKAIIPYRARGYRSIDGCIENAPYLSMSQPFAAGALASTVEDLITWQRGLVNHKSLNEASYGLMTTKGVRSGGEETNYGMGLFIQKSNGRKVIRHGGGINGFCSDLIYYPDSDHTIVVLANAENARPDAISNRIAAVLFKPTSSVPAETP